MEPPPRPVPVGSPVWAMKFDYATMLLSLFLFTVEFTVGKRNGKYVISGFINGFSVNSYLYKYRKCQVHLKAKYIYIFLTRNIKTKEWLYTVIILILESVRKELLGIFFKNKFYKTYQQFIHPCTVWKRQRLYFFCLHNFRKFNEDFGLS